MAHRIEMLTVVFADISGSTGIVRRHGDLSARDFFQRCLQRVAATMEAHGGRISGRFGDELMCVLPDARRAIHMALAIQDAVGAGGQAGEYPDDLKMHIGMQTGPVIVERSELFGDTIHTAKRMVDLAKANQILTTQDLIRSVEPLADVHFRLVDEMRIKGHARPVAIYELMRRDVSETLVSICLPKASAGELYQRCRLRYLDSTFVVDAAHPILTIGRSDDCDLTLIGIGVSRSHGHLEYQKGRIIYVDQSTNGTLIQENDASEPVLVHHEQRWLRRHGRLLYGERGDPAPGLTLVYACDTGDEKPTPDPAGSPVASG
jgi:adenylate cyclase